MSRLATMINRERWSDSDRAMLRQLIKLELPMCFIARKLERPEQMVRKEAHRVAMAEMLGSSTKVVL